MHGREKSSSCSTTTTYSYSIENKDQADIRDSKTQKEYLFWYGISIWYKSYMIYFLIFETKVRGGFLVGDPGYGL